MTTSFPLGNTLTMIVITMLMLGGAAATAVLAQKPTDLIGTWLVTVEGEVRPRVLRVQGAEQRADGTLVLDARYGWVHGKDAVVPAEVAQFPQQPKLVLTTQANSVIVATRSLEGNFSGSITYKSGVVKSVKLARTAESDLAALGKSAGVKALQKDEVQKLIAGKVLVVRRLRDGALIRWDIRSDGNLYGNNMTTGSSDSAKWVINDDGSLCVEWRGASESSCLYLVRGPQGYTLNSGSGRGTPRLVVSSIE